MTPSLLLALAAGATAATYAEQYDLDDLSGIAESVVIGDVLATRCEASRNGIYTVATVRVTETLRGTPEPIIEVRVPGGRVADIELTVAGAPRLIEGYEVLLFLDGERIVGLGQGAFVVDSGQAWRNVSDDVFANPRMEREIQDRDIDDRYITYSLADVRRAVR